MHTEDAKMSPASTVPGSNSVHPGRAVHTDACGSATAGSHDQSVDVRPHRGRSWWRNLRVRARCEVSARAIQGLRCMGAWQKRMLVLCRNSCSVRGRESAAGGAGPAREQLHHSALC